LKRTQIECVALGLGPGSYNGIRGAIALAQGWQLASGVKLIGVSSVECIAAQAQAEKIFGAVAVVIDAQRGELYVENYDIGIKSLKNTIPLRIMTLTELNAAGNELRQVVGPEIGNWLSVGRCVFPSAATLGQLASNRNDFVSGSELTPIYLRATTFVKAPPLRDLPTL
jgi:tRNA threonylcarbamoyl adenosine modification protein YeaZ